MKITKAFELKIENPCTENFDAMPRTNCGMFCGKCQKEVIDFTNLTDVELIDILKRKPDTCGVYRGDQLNKFYQYDEVIPEKKPFRLWVSILTFAALLGFRTADAQMRSGTAQQKAATTGKNIPKNERIYCKLVDKYNNSFAHVKVTAGVEQVETDKDGLFDIRNPFSATTQVVTLNFEFDGTYMYEQLHASNVKDVAVNFKFNVEEPHVNGHSAVLTRDDIMRSGGLIDMTKVVAAGGTGITTNDRSNGLVGSGGSRGNSTITIIDGIVISDGQTTTPKKEGFFKRLFRRKAK